MGSLTSLMDLARQTLVADQNALNATSNNVANQNTPGYTREAVAWQMNDVVTLSGTSYTAAVTSSASSQRDLALERRVQAQTQAQAQSGALEDVLQQVENVFGLSSTASSPASTALGTAMNSFFSSLSALTANPSDTSLRQSVLSAANALASTFNATSNQISQITSNLNEQVGGVVDQVNSLTATIASLNGKIGGASPDADAGVLEDQRQQAIASLSKLIGLNQVLTENNGITLTTSNGAVLVDGSKSFALQTTDVAGATHVIAGDTGADITAGLTGGQLGGVLVARDQKIPGYMASLDDLAYAVGTKVNAQNALGLDGYGSPGGNLFTLPAGPTGAAVAIATATGDPLAVAAAAPGEGSASNGNALALADIANSVMVGGETAGGYYAALLGQIGSDASEASTDNTAQQAALTQLTSERDSFSRVSLDEEAANLTQYQRSYEAAAKLFSISDSLMADALNLGVQSAVS